jgi:hypothetical protein
MIDSSPPRPISDTGLWQTYINHRYAVLFYLLLSMLIAMPITVTLGMPQGALKVLVAGCLLAAVMPNATRGSRYAILTAILLLTLLRFAAERDDVPIDFGPVLALYGLTGLLAAAGTLRFVIRSPIVDAETVYAALSTYLLAGLFFAVIYSAMEFASPGSFTGPSAFTEPTAVYYSFVTLATLGYGDFLPRSELARGIATFEVIGGQLYLAVMVARLIGAFGPAKQHS